MHLVQHELRSRLVSLLARLWLDRLRLVELGEMLRQHEKRRCFVQDAASSSVMHSELPWQSHSAGFWAGLSDMIRVGLDGWIHLQASSFRRHSRDAGHPLTNACFTTLKPPPSSNGDFTTHLLDRLMTATTTDSKGWMSILATKNTTYSTKSLGIGLRPAFPRVSYCDGVLISATCE